MWWEAWCGGKLGVEASSGGSRAFDRRECKGGKLRRSRAFEVAEGSLGRGIEEEGKSQDGVGM